MELGLRCWLGGEELPLCRDQVLTTVFHQTRAPAFAQVRTYAEAKATPTEVSSILEQRIRGVQEENSLAETGRVLSVGYATPDHRRQKRIGKLTRLTVTVSPVSME
jgi:hypothetical protein